MEMRLEAWEAQGEGEMFFPSLEEACSEGRSIKMVLHDTWETVNKTTECSSLQGQSVWKPRTAPGGRVKEM